MLDGYWVRRTPEHRELQDTAEEVEQEVDWGINRSATWVKRLGGLYE